MLPGPVIGIAGGVLWSIAGLVRALAKGEKFNLYKFLKSLVIGAVYGWLAGPSAINELYTIVGATAVTDKLISMLKDYVFGGEEES